MSSQTPSKILKRLDQFASAELIHVRHTRRMHKTIWTIVACSVGWLACQLLIVIGMPAEWTPPGLSMSWIEGYLWDSTRVFDSEFLIVGWVHAVQLFLCAVMLISIIKTAYAHINLPKIIEQAQHKRSTLNAKTLHGLFEGTIDANQETDDALETSTRWVHKTIRNTSLVSLMLCLVPVLSMNNLGENIFKVDRWERAIREGFIGEAAFIPLAIGGFGLVALPLYILTMLSRIHDRKTLKLAREDMLVLQNDIFGSTMEGGLSRAEAAQGGELSLRQKGELSVEE